MNRFSSQYHEHAFYLNLDFSSLYLQPGENSGSSLIFRESSKHWLI